jgi:hypothetical protein
VEEEKEDERPRLAEGETNARWWAQGGGPFTPEVMCRKPDGTIDEEREQPRIEALMEKARSKTFNEGQHKRAFPLWASFDSVHQPPGSKGEQKPVERTQEWKDKEATLRAERRAKEADIPKVWPLNHDAMAEALRNHPSNLECSLLLDMLRNGANCAYTGPRTEMIVGKRAREEIEEDTRAAAEGRTRPLTEKQIRLAEEMDKEVAAGNLVGFFKEPPFPNSIICSASLVPKTEEGIEIEGESRVTIAPHEANECTERIWCGLASWDEVTSKVLGTQKKGKGGKIAKEDAVKAFRMLRYREQDQHCFVVYVRGRGYAYHRALNMGGRSSPALYSRVGRAMEWIFQNKAGAKALLTYVDDHMFFFTCDEDAEEVMNKVRATAKAVGFQLSDKKRMLGTKGPLLGITVDLDTMTLSVSDARKANIIGALRDMAGMEKTVKKRVEEVVGVLDFLDKVVPLMKPFMGRLRRAATNAARAEVAKGKRTWEELNPNRLSVQITPAIREDLTLVAGYLEAWKGTAAVLPEAWETDGYLGQATTGADASLQGYGGCSGEKWLAAEWTEGEKEDARRTGAVSLQYYELLAHLKLNMAMDGEWRGKRIVGACDNLGVVEAVNNGGAKHEALAELVRSIMLRAMEGGYEYKMVWITGAQNNLPDLLSRPQEGGVDRAKKTFGLREESRCRAPEWRLREESRGQAPEGRPKGGRAA